MKRFRKSFRFLSPTKHIPTESFYKKAEAQYSNGNYIAAITNYSKAIDMDPNNYMAFSANAVNHLLKSSID